MSKNNIIELDGLATISDPLTDYLRNCAQSLLHVALENEVQELLSNCQDRRLPMVVPLSYEMVTNQSEISKPAWGRSRYRFPRYAPKMESL